MAKKTDNPLGTPLSPTYFPAQKRTDKEKTEQYYKDCVNAGLTLANWNTNNVGATGVRTSRKNKVINYNLYNDIVDKREMERVVNPLGLEDVDFPATYKNYPLLNDSINLLGGEERNRIFYPMVTVINSDAITEKIRGIDEAFSQFYIQKLTQEKLDQNKLQAELQSFGRWAKFNYKDKRERMASQVLKYLYHTQDLAEEFSRGFKDALIAGEEIYVIEIYDGEPYLRKANPLNIYTLRSGSSWKVEDADIIIEDVYLPMGETLDRYHEFLTGENIRTLEEGHLLSVGSKNSLYSSQIMNPVWNINTVIDNPEDLGITIMTGFNTSYFNGSYDSDGNIRVTRVVWRGMRLVKVKSYIDEDGERQEEFMPEQWKPNKEIGEEAKDMWITEWQEGTRIGNDIYVKCQPCEIQMRHRDNISISHPGIVGTIYNTNSSKGRSLMDIGRDYQYLYNLFMYRMQLAVMKDKGRIGLIPFHLMPDGWDISKWLYYGEYFGWAPIDAFNEGQKGVAKGKLAPTNTPTDIDLSAGDYVQRQVMLLDFIERRVESLTGISPQRKGAINNRETVGGVERAVQQSSHITEEWFKIHDNTKVRALRALLEAAKIAYRNSTSFVREFVLDDGTKEILEFDYDTFVEASYGVDVSNATRDMMSLQKMQSLADRFIQVNAPLSIVTDLLSTEDIASLRRKIETYDEELKQQQQQQAQAQQQEITAKLQQEVAIKQAELDQAYQLEIEKLDREDMNKELDRQNKIYLEEIRAMAFDPNKDANENSVPDILEQGKLALENTKASFEHMTKQKDASDRKEIENKKIALEEKRMKHEEKLQKIKDDAAMKREQLKARTAKSNPVAGEKK